MQLRLLITERCNRSCPMCCNKGHDLVALPVCSDFSSFGPILITGGEPLLDMGLLRAAVKDIRSQTQAPIYVYTAWTNPWDILETLMATDGITLTLHTKDDVGAFTRLDRLLWLVPSLACKSLRLNIFKGTHPGTLDSRWKVKVMRWQKDCPVPANEVFMRYQPSEVSK